MATSTRYAEELPVRVSNPSNREHVLKWDGVRYRVPARGESIVPFMAMARVAGNPNSSGDTEARRLEYERLRAFHSLGTIDHPSLDPDDFGLEFYTLDGDRITTVLEDPTGESTTTFKETRSEAEFLREQLEMMMRNQRRMEAQLAQLTRGHIAEEMGVDPEPDGDPGYRYDPNSPRDQGRPHAIDTGDLGGEYSEEGSEVDSVPGDGHVGSDKGVASPKGQSGDEGQGDSGVKEDKPSVPKGPSTGSTTRRTTSKGN